MSLGRWLRNRSRGLELAYQATHYLFKWLDPILVRIGYDRTERWLRPAEELSKSLIFDCRMCGQCILHSTGMTCPMTCPKNLRNGPCGGVRVNGNCEVIPDMPCVWVEAVERANHMRTFGSELILIQPPVDQQLRGSSAWVNMLSGRDMELPPGWLQVSTPSTFKT
jgi:hypothetical protein